MRFATWNVNSIRTRVDRVIAFLQRSDTDVLAMQEIKCRPDQFPIEPFEEAGYHVAIHGLNQWNGVAVASRLPILEVRDHFPTQPAFGEPPVVEARALGVTVDTTGVLPAEEGQASSMTIWSLYVPNGRELTHAHYAYKLQWLANLAEQGRDWLSDPEAHIALVGDWNVAPLDEDVWDMSVFEGATHVSAPEREAFAAFAADGGTVIISSHVMATVQRLCTHVAIIARGRVLTAGTTAQVAAGEDLEDRFTQLVGGPAAREELSWLRPSSD